MKVFKAKEFLNIENFEYFWSQIFFVGILNKNLDGG